MGLSSKYFSRAFSMTNVFEIPVFFFAVHIEPFQQLWRNPKRPRGPIRLLVLVSHHTASFPATASFALTMNASLKSTTSLMTSFSMALIYAAMYSQSGMNPSG